MDNPPHKLWLHIAFTLNLILAVLLILWLLHVAPVLLVDDALIRHSAESALRHRLEQTLWLPGLLLTLQTGLLCWLAGYIHQQRQKPRIGQAALDHTPTDTPTDSPDSTAIEATNQPAAIAYTRLLDAIESLTEGFALYDSDEQLVVCNRNYRECWKPLDSRIKPGMTFHTLCEWLWDSGLVADTVLTRDAWLAQRLERYRNAQGSFKHRLPGDRWLWLSERRTQDGGTVMVVMDITEQYRLEQELVRQASTDSLTNAANRRHFLELAEKEIARAQRYQHALSVLQIDVDHFKRINDLYGHATGDHVLRRLVNTCRNALRESDTVGRLGGEEFAILLPNTNEKQASDVAERLRVGLAELRIATRNDFLQFSVSIGVAECRSHETIDQTLNRADQALYRAKHLGRNRIVCHSRLTPLPPYPPPIEQEHAGP